MLEAKKQASKGAISNRCKERMASLKKAEKRAKNRDCKIMWRTKQRELTDKYISNISRSIVS